MSCFTACDYMSHLEEQKKKQSVKLQSLRKEVKALEIMKEYELILYILFLFTVCFSVCFSVCFNMCFSLCFSLCFIVCFSVCFNVHQCVLQCASVCTLMFASVCAYVCFSVCFNVCFNVLQCVLQCASVCALMFASVCTSRYGIYVAVIFLWVCMLSVCMSANLFTDNGPMSTLNHCPSQEL